VISIPPLRREGTSEPSSLWQIAHGHFHFTRYEIECIGSRARAPRGKGGHCPATTWPQ
jgi:hypothetical protein